MENKKKSTNEAPEAIRPTNQPATHTTDYTNHWSSFTLILPRDHLEKNSRIIKGLAQSLHRIHYQSTLLMHHTTEWLELTQSWSHFRLLLWLTQRQ